MIFSSFIAAAVLAQSPMPQDASSQNNATPAAEQVDVAYNELVEGRTEAAIAVIRANREIAADDPAALINLGAAYARTGRHREAQSLYRAAIASDDRYDLQLADGRWMDSRRAARLALDLQARGEALAVR